MVGGRSERGSRRPVHAASVVVPFPRSAAGDRLDLARIVPSGRSLLLAVAIAAAAAAAYWGAYATSVFAVERIEVRGAPPDVKRQVDAATKELLGRSLVAVDADAVEGALRGLPTIAGASVDRAFPHSLVVKVAPERPVAVARRGHSAYLVTGTGSVIREIEPGSEQALPRLWIPRAVTLYVGGRLPAAYAPATRALVAAREVGFRRGLKGVRSPNDELVLVLRHGPEIRLGAATDLGLKIAVARLVLRHLATGMEYVDVSVPERPVAG